MIIYYFSQILWVRNLGEVQQAGTESESFMKLQSVGWNCSHLKAGLPRGLIHRTRRYFECCLEASVPLLVGLSMGMILKDFHGMVSGFPRESKRPKKK